MFNAGDYVKCILVGNKKDLEYLRVISKDEGINLAKEKNIPFFEVSALTDDNISELMQKLAIEMFLSASTSKYYIDN